VKREGREGEGKNGREKEGRVREWRVKTCCPMSNKLSPPMLSPNQFAIYTSRWFVCNISDRLELMS